MKRSSCLVNPFACYETELKIQKSPAPKRVAVVGAGPSGIACATTLVDAGHTVSLYDRGDAIGGQFNLAKLIPGKMDFYDAIKYWGKQIELRSDLLTLRLKTEFTVVELEKEGFDSVVVCTGSEPRDVSDKVISGVSANLTKVCTYRDVLRGQVTPGPSVAVIGAGGIGFDVSIFLTHDPVHSVDIPKFNAEWGVDSEGLSRGGIKKQEPPKPKRQVTIFQRSSGKVGGKLGVTTGWIHRKSLQQHGVQFIGGATYKKITEKGLLYSVKPSKDKAPVDEFLEVDTIVFCHGQNPVQTLTKALEEYSKTSKKKFSLHVAGGCREAMELDAKKAIRDGVVTAMSV